MPTLVENNFFPEPYPQPTLVFHFHIRGRKKTQNTREGHSLGTRAHRTLGFNWKNTEHFTHFPPCHKPAVEQEWSTAERAATCGLPLQRVIREAQR